MPATTQGRPASSEGQMRRGWSRHTIACWRIKAPAAAIALPIIRSDPSLPKSPPTPCSHPGCHAYSVSQSRCEKHKRVGWSDKRGSAEDRGYGQEWRKVRAAVLDRDMRMCQRCYRQGRYKAGNEVDHIVPKARGGRDTLSNLEVICRDCHRDKTAQESLQERGGGYNR